MSTHAIQRASLGSKTVPASKSANNATTGKVQAQAMAAKNQWAAGHKAIMNGVLGPMKVSAPAGSAMKRGIILVDTGVGVQKARAQRCKASKINDTEGMVRAEQDLHVSEALSLGTVANVPNDLVAMGVVTPKTAVATNAVSGAKTFGLGLLSMGLLKKSYDEKQRANQVTEFIKKVESSNNIEDVLNKNSDILVHHEKIKRMAGSDVLNKLESEGYITTDTNGNITVNNAEKAKIVLLAGAKRVRTGHKVASITSGIFGVSVSIAFTLGFLALIGCPITGVPLAIISTISTGLMSVLALKGFAAQAQTLYKAGLYRELALLTLVTLASTVLMISGLEYVAIGVEILYLIGLVLYKTDALAVNLYSKEFIYLS